MGLLTRPRIFVEIRLAKYPAALGVDVLRYSKGGGKGTSQAGRFYEPRIVSVSPIRREATDQDGNYSVSSFSVTLNDQDGDIADMLEAGEDTEYFLAREIAVWAISEQGLAAGLNTATVQPVARGWISDVQRQAWTVVVTGSDAVGSQMSRSNLDKKALQHKFEDIVTAAGLTPLEDTKDLRFRIALGEYSDRGRTDAFGNPAERGRWPAREVCEIDITSLLTAPPVPTFVDPPVITASSVTGATGQETLYYGATVVTPFGESALSNVVSLNGASKANRNVSNYNEISGTFDAGPDPLNPYKVRIWVGYSATAMVGWLDEANYNGSGVFGYFDGAAAWPTATRDELDDIKAMSLPTGGAPTNPNVFSIMEICLGYGYDLLDVWASDLANGVEPKRMLETVFGSEIIRPQDPEWPFPDPWIEMGGIKFFGFLARGNKLQHHRDRTVTMAVNFCGPHDGSSLLINQAFPQLQFLVNEYLVKNKGNGYFDQVYGTLEAYDDGTPLVKPTEYAARQDETKAWLGDSVGYLGNIFVDDPEDTWRDVLREAFSSFGCKGAVNRFGQHFPILVPTSDDAVAGRAWREKMEIKRRADPLLSHDQIVNRVLMSYWYDQDAGEYAGVDIPSNSDASIAAHVPGGVIGSNDFRGLREMKLALKYVSDAATAADVAERTKIRRKRRPRYPSAVVGMMGIDHDLGGRGRLFDARGRDAGTKVMILAHETDLDSQEVTLTYLDLTSVWA